MNSSIPKSEVSTKPGQLHSLELLEICDDAEKLSKELVSEWLQKYMFAGQTGKEEGIGAAVGFLSNYDEHKTHTRPLTLEKLKPFNLKITVAEGALSGLIWEAYILLSGFFGSSAFVKLYENSDNISWGRQFQIQQQVLQLQPVPGSP